jgi:NADH-quinone oxidoreductase subunit C
MKDTFPDLSHRFDYEYLGFNPLAGGHQLKVNKIKVKELLDFLFRDQEFWCDYLVSISGEHKVLNDLPIVVHYHICSITTDYQIHIQTESKINESGLAEFDTVSDIWKTANWHERETAELYGVNFLGHSDLRNLLLPATWQGFPLRKDYKEQEEFHGVKVKY